MGRIARLKLQIYACGYTEISEEFLVIIHWGFTPVLPLFYPSQISGIKKPTVSGWFS